MFWKSNCILGMYFGVWTRFRKWNFVVKSCFWSSPKFWHFENEIGFPNYSLEIQNFRPYFMSTSCTSQDWNQTWTNCGTLLHSSMLMTLALQSWLMTRSTSGLIYNNFASEASFLINICSAGGSSASCTYSGRGPYGWPPSYFSSQRRHTFFFSFEKGPPMRHLQFILVPYLQCHKLLANSRKWFPAETCSPMLYRLFIIRTT